MRAWSARSDSLPAFGARNSSKDFGASACTIESRWQRDAVLRLGREERRDALEWVRCLRGSPSSARM